METNIILIGPMRAGKTTIGRLLAEHIGVQQVSLDKLRWDYYTEIGYDAEHAKTLSVQDGHEAVLRYVKPFEVHAVRRVLEDYPSGTVIDFGAGHSVYEDEGQFAQVQQALSGYCYVILLIPSPDPDESVRILHQRDLDDGESGLPVFNEHFVRHASNARLATHVVYTKGKLPTETAEEILGLLVL